MSEQPIEADDSPKPNANPASQQNQIDRIESLVVDLRDRLAEETLRRKQASVFYWVCAVHALLTWLCLSFIDVIETIHTGWYAGMLTTLGVWHGISLRPIGERWKRSLIAACIVSTGALLHGDLELDDLLLSLGPATFLLVGSAGVAAWVLRLAVHRGVEPPEKLVIQASRLSALNLFVLATWVAFAATAIQFVEFIERDAQLALCSFALIVGAMAAWVIIEAAAKPKLWWSVRIGVFVPLTLFILYFSLLTLFPDSTADRIEAIRLSAGLTCFHLISPVATSLVFIKSGYRTVNAPARELEAQSQDSSDQIWAKEPSSRAFEDESESAIRQQDEA